MPHNPPVQSPAELPSSQASADDEVLVVGTRAFDALFAMFEADARLATLLGLDPVAGTSFGGFA